jgi:hypothetical protein
MTKLLYCPDCRKVTSLEYNKLVTCRCGACAGLYDAKEPCHATVWGEKALVFGLANEDLSNAGYIMDNPYKVDLLRCWVVRPGVYDWRELTIERTAPPDPEDVVVPDETIRKLYRDMGHKVEATMKDHQDQLPNGQLYGVYVPQTE